MDAIQDRGHVLRQRAEAILAERPVARSEPVGVELLALLHDLGVHQIELELQNEELRAAQQLATQARDDYARLYHQAPVGYLTLDARGVVLQANETLARMLRVDLRAILGQPLAGFFAPADRDVFLARYNAFFKAPLGKGMEAVMCRPAGGSFCARITGRHDAPPNFMGRHAAQPTILAVIDDISEMRQAQEEIVAEKERLAATLSSIGDAVVSTDAIGTIVLMNPAAEGLTGWSAPEAVGHPIGEVFPAVDEQTHQACPDPVRKVLGGDPSQTMPSHALLVRRDKGERIIANRGAPIRDAGGHVVGAVVAYRDMTEEVLAQRELQRVARLDSLGIMAGGIAHDFNNLLAAIAGNMGVAQEAIRDQDSTEACRCLDDAQTAAKRASDLTRQFLTFSRGGKPLRSLVTLPTVIREAVGLALTGSRSRSRIDMPDTLWPVYADVGQIAQVLHNLLLNADQAMPQGGTIDVEASNVHVEADDISLVPAGPYVRIDVADTGIGIAPEVKDRIFDPYFSTKQRGSGLGLASAHSIVRNHEGCITVESIVGKGTRLSVFLPARPAQTPQPEQEPPRAVAMRPWHILALDDEPLVARMISRILTSAGHSVVAVTDGVAAIEAWTRAQAEARPFDLAILDLTVPGGMGGAEVVARLRPSYPGMRVIASSGYATDPILAKYEEYGFDGCLPKPYSKDEALALVASLQARASRTSGGS